MFSGVMNNKKGSALLYVVLVVFIVAVMSGIVANMLTYEIKVNKVTEEKLKAKYLAESGIEHAMLENSEVHEETVYDDAGNELYQYSVALSGGVIRIESCGFVNNTKRVKIVCEIKNDTVSKWEETYLK